MISYIKTDDDRLVSRDHIVTMNFHDEADKSIATLCAADGTALGTLTASNRVDLIKMIAEAMEGPDFAGDLATTVAADDVFGDGSEIMLNKMREKLTAGILERFGSHISAEQAAKLCIEVFIERMQWHVYSQFDADRARKQSMN